MKRPSLSRPLGFFLLVALLLVPQLAQAEIKEVVSRGGVHAWLIEDHSLPLITVNFAFEGGSALDPAGKEGRASLLASLLDEGAGDLDSRAFQQALAERSIALGFSADEDALFGQLKTLSREQANAFALLRLALHNARFETEAIGRMRDSLVAQRQYGLSDPNWLASQAFEQVAMTGHPYGRPANGTVATLGAITRDDLVAAVPQHLVKNRLHIAVVGDMTAAALAVTLDQVFADLAVGADSVQLPPLTVTGAGQTVLIERDQPQTVLLAGMPGIKREDPDWFAALTMNYILGGDFQSRLMSEIRIKRGLTYGISTALVPYKAGGMFYAMASADNAKVAELLTRLKDEMRRLVKDGVTATELSEAKTYLTGAFALRFNSSDGIAAVLLEIQRLGFSPTYLNERAKQIDAVTSADVARLAEQLVRPDAMTTIVVGKPAGIESTSTVSIKP
jgi:zinc protease